MNAVLCRVPPSDGAMILSQGLGVRRVTPDGARKMKARTIINWGCHEINKRDNQRVFNLPESIQASVDKRVAFASMRDGGVRVPLFVTDNPQSLRVRKDTIVVARLRPAASGGAGIVIVRPKQEFPAAPLYVQYIKKTEEYRVHVAFGQAIHVVQKRRRNGVDASADHKLIRNHGDVWVFCENDLACDADESRPALEEQAVKAISAVGLHFGAVDIVREVDTKEYYVLETNSKPGIVSEATWNAYCNALKQRLGEEK